MKILLIQKDIMSKNNLATIVTAFLVAFINFYILTCLILVEVSSSLIYENSEPEAVKFETSLDYRQQFTRTKNGDKIDLKFFKYRGNNTESTENSKIYLYLHGNIGRLPYIIEGLTDYGDVVTPAYPGYNESTGKPSEEDIYRTVDATMEFLFQSGFKEEDIIVLGHSLGGSPAIYAATKYQNLDRVILVNTFYSIQKMCERDYSILCAFGGSIHNSAKFANDAKAPIRHFHNQNDEMIPFEQGKLLHNKIASEDKKFYDDISGTHGDFVIDEVMRIN